MFTVFLRGDAGFDTFVLQGFAEPVGIIALVSQEMIGGREQVDKQGSTLEVTHLSCGQTQEARTSLSIANCVQLAVQAAFCAANVAGNIPFLSRLQAVRWAFR